MCSEQKKIKQLKYLQLAMEKGKSLLSEEDTVYLRECPHPGHRQRWEEDGCVAHSSIGEDGCHDPSNLARAVEKHPPPAHRGSGEPPKENILPWADHQAR
jgi:hypothetical protein